MKTAVIMQPTYLPWLGYFDLMDQSDVFVLLDSIQFDKRSWQQRNRIKTAHGELFLTVPVLSKGRREQKICDVEIDASRRFGYKHISTVRNAYSRAEFLDKYITDFEAIESKNHRYLVDLNIELIEWFRGNLGIKTQLLRSSSMNVQGTNVDLLVAICQYVGATEYLSPLGSKVYIDGNNIFSQHGISLVYHDYQHPHYRQLHHEFIPFLSALDLLMNEGDRSLSVIRSGRASVSRL